VKESRYQIEGCMEGGGASLFRRKKGENFVAEREGEGDL